MNHQPFEEWLLSEKLIDPKQKLDLDAHLRVCGYCSALAETGKALRTVKKVSPVTGFSTRFQARLAAQKVAERLASLFIEENLRDRENMADDTNRFLDSQLDEAPAPE